MRKVFDKAALDAVSFLLGDAETVAAMPELPAKEPFCDEVLDCLNAVSESMRKHPQARIYSDVATLGFWLRRASLLQMRKQYLPDDQAIRLGRGVILHIAPSNVAVNYAYSLAAGILAGNANIVRLPSKAFPQVEIINEAVSAALERYPAMKPYFCLMRYGRDKAVNDALSAIADVRVVWGGDATIAELRKSPLPPRSTEVLFADRYSFAVIHADAYLEADRDAVIAQDFYNDTYLSDQNACTSPRLVVWTGTQRKEAKQRFWNALHELALKKYQFQPIMGVNKLTSAYRAASAIEGTQIEAREDNLLVRVQVSKLTSDLIELRDNSGYFYEYECDDLMELRELCDDNRCQTLSYIGDKKMLLPLLKSGIKGIDRAVPVGHSMDFSMVWDGYDLAERLTRVISL